jgi:hypothetical protein
VIARLAYGFRGTRVLSSSMKRTFWLTGIALLLRVHGAQTQGFAPYPLLREGETLQYQIESERFGTIGTARLRVELDSTHERSAYRISLDFAARFPGFAGTGYAHTWIDAETLSTLYMTRCVRTAAGERVELVDIATALNAWSDSAGAHPLDSTEPLDELALLYLLRSLSDPDVAEPLLLDRHYDGARNPVRIRPLGRAATVAMGSTYEAMILQLEMRQAGQQIRSAIVHLSSDAARLPLRIELSLAGVGALRLTLQQVGEARRIVLDAGS